MTKETIMEELTHRNRPSCALRKSHHANSHSAIPDRLQAATDSLRNRSFPVPTSSYIFKSRFAPACG